MVVTPAPSSPDSVVDSHPLRQDLLQGRVATQWKVRMVEYGRVWW